MIDFDSLVIGPATAIFGRQVWYRPPGVQPIAIVGVFDAGAKQIKGFGSDGVAITDVRPVLGIRLSDLVAAGITPQQGDKVTVIDDAGGQTDYQVSNVDPDGQGAAKLSLNQLKVPA